MTNPTFLGIKAGHGFNHHLAVNSLSSLKSTNQPTQKRTSTTSWWSPPIGKNISQNGNLPQVGVKIPKIFELPPPRQSFQLNDLFQPHNERLGHHLHLCCCQPPQTPNRAPQTHLHVVSGYGPNRITVSSRTHAKAWRDLSPLKGERLSAEARLFRNPPGNFPLNPGCLRSRDPGKTYGPWFMFHSPPHDWVEHYPLKIS